MLEVSRLLRELAKQGLCVDVYKRQPYLCIWLAARDLIEVAPNWTQAQSVARYGWLAFGAAFGGIVLYFGGLMCTHPVSYTHLDVYKRQV